MGNINSYFKSEPKPKPGRPSKESNAGRKSAAPSENMWTGLKPPTAAEKAAAAKANSTARNLASAANKAKSGEMLDAVETAAIIKAAASTAKAPGVKKCRTNWSLKENAERMSKAVNGWPAYKAANPTFSMEGYAKSLNINPVTLSKYISGERVLGKGQGRPGILKSDEATFITDVVRRYDRGRDGLTPAGVISLVASVKPNLSEKQANNLAHNLRRPSSTQRLRRSA